MQVVETAIADVKVIIPRVYSDERGFFLETYQARKYAEAGISTEFVQDNHSRSTRGTLRGLHYQLEQPQAKLCRVIQGEVFDVAVDLRKGSPTFGKWVGEVLSSENHRQIYVPHGFAHGFLVMSETAEFLYKCDAYYSPQDEHGIAWDDPDLGIDWPTTAGAPLLSLKDGALPGLAQVASHHLPEYSPSVPLDRAASRKLLTHV